MKRVVWSCGVLATFALLLFPARAALAQGVTSAAVAGRVTDESGAGVPGAVLTLVNGSTGQRYSRRSAADGRYNFENVAVGGPYTLQTRALGFEAKQSDPFNLTLGQRFEVSVSLKRAAVGLEAVTVTGEANPLVSRSRTGTQSIVSDSIIHHLRDRHDEIGEIAAQGWEAVDDRVRNDTLRSGARARNEGVGLPRDRYGLKSHRGALERHVHLEPLAQRQSERVALLRLEAERASLQRVRATDGDVLEVVPAIVGRAPRIALAGGAVHQCEDRAGHPGAGLVSHTPRDRRRGDALRQRRAGRKQQQGKRGKHAT